MQLLEDKLSNFSYLRQLENPIHNMRQLPHGTTSITSKLKLPHVAKCNFSCVLPSPASRVELLHATYTRRIPVCRGIADGIGGVLGPKGRGQRVLGSRGHGVAVLWAGMEGTCKQLQLRTNVYDSQKLIWSGMSGSDVIILDDGKPYFSWIVHVV
ncbi:hypothetical protein B0H13DRAFT_1855522 [Mycena leptocephala]|nr:hypothetical protein B0H13DRAFT_1855522 [Mycena leptocephala]